MTTDTTHINAEALEALYNALKVITLNPQTVIAIGAIDPKALRQAQDAIAAAEHPAAPTYVIEAWVTFDTWATQGDYVDEPLPYRLTADFRTDDNEHANYDVAAAVSRHFKGGISTDAEYSCFYAYTANEADMQALTQFLADLVAHQGNVLTVTTY